MHRAFTDQSLNIEATLWRNRLAAEQAPDAPPPMELPPRYERRPEHDIRHCGASNSDAWYDYEQLELIYRGWARSKLLNAVLAAKPQPSAPCPRCDGTDKPCDRPATHTGTYFVGFEYGAAVAETLHLCDEHFAKWESWRAREERAAEPQPSVPCPWCGEPPHKPENCPAIVKAVVRAILAPVARRISVMERDGEYLAFVDHILYAIKDTPETAHLAAWNYAYAEQVGVV